MRSRQDSDVLFSNGHLHEWLASRLEAGIRDVEGLPEQRLLGTPIDDLIEHFSQKHQIEMVAIERDAITVSEHGDVAVPKRDFGREYVGQVHGVSFAVPFTGEPALFRYQGSTWTSMYPRAQIGEHELTITILSEEPDGAALRQKLERELNLIHQFLEGVSPMVSEYNQRVFTEARTRLEVRKKRVLERNSLVANIGFPVRARGQQTTSVPLVRKRIVPSLPPLEPGGFQPEPAISDEDYEAILRTMHQMTLVMERSPASFATADEETIRTHFLVALNAHYEGAATGETFNGVGKTDILIRYQGKNIFIGECKFWKGPDGLVKAIDQLMSYMSWRDTKCAVVLLVRDTEMTTVLSKVPDVVRGHLLFKREKPVSEATWFRAILHHRGDRNREALLTVMVFDVPRQAEAVLFKHPPYVLYNSQSFRRIDTLLCLLPVRNRIDVHDEIHWFPSHFSVDRNGPGPLAITQSSATKNLNSQISRYKFRHLPCALSGYRIMRATPQPERVPETRPGSAVPTQDRTRRIRLGEMSAEIDPARDGT
jgi:hypothetical protein